VTKEIHRFGETRPSRQQWAPEIVLGFQALLMSNSLAFVNEGYKRASIG